MKKLVIGSLCLFVGVLTLGCGGAGDATPSTLLGFGSFTAELIGTAQMPVTTSSANGANATGIAGAQFDKLMFTAAGENTLADTKIVFSSNRDGNQEIYTMNSDGSSLTRLTVSAGTDDQPVFSPDGTKIAFTSARDGNFEVYVMNADGSNPTRLTNDATADKEPAWSPDGSRLAFVSGRDGNSELYKMNANGSSQTRITNNTETDVKPSWSPDGTKLVFYSNKDGDFDIYTINTSGFGQVNLMDNISVEMSPSWSPDGTKICFSTGRHGPLEIYTMSADGSNQTRVTNNLVVDETPTFSPDGTQILFVSSREANTDIYKMNVDGSNVLNVSRNVDFADIAPAWSGYLARTQRTLIGAGGPLGTVGAGLIFSQRFDQVKSVLSFDTTTQTLAARAAARITAQTTSETSGTSLIFTVTTTTGLGSMKYAPVSENGVPGIVTTIGMPVGVSAALVSFSASTGLLGSVIPFTATRSPLSQPQRVGNEVTFTGSFDAVLDAEGKPVSPGGANSVTIDERTGMVVRYR